MIGCKRKKQSKDGGCSYMGMDHVDAALLRGGYVSRQHVELMFLQYIEDGG